MRGMAHVRARSLVESRESAKSQGCAHKSLGLNLLYLSKLPGMVLLCHRLPFTMNSQSFIFLGLLRSIDAQLQAKVRNCLGTVRIDFLVKREFLANNETRQ